MVEGAQCLELQSSRDKAVARQKMEVALKVECIVLADLAEDPKAERIAHVLVVAVEVVRAVVGLNWMNPSCFYQMVVLEEKYSSALVGMGSSTRKKKPGLLLQQCLGGP